jgi:hypothetical protein
MSNKQLAWVILFVAVQICIVSAIVIALMRWLAGPQATRVSYCIYDVAMMSVAIIAINAAYWRNWRKPRPNTHS